MICSKVESLKIQRKIKRVDLLDGKETKEVSDSDGLQNLVTYRGASRQKSEAQKV